MLMWLNISLHRDKLLPIEGLLWMCLARDDIKFQFIIKNSDLIILLIIIRFYCEIKENSNQKKKVKIKKYMN